MFYRIGDLRLRAGEKQVNIHAADYNNFLANVSTQIYKKMSDHNDIRFRTKIEKASDKAFIIMQVKYIPSHLVMTRLS